MTTAADQFNDTPSPTDLQQFVYLANSVVELVETAKRELERDREAAKTSLATTSSILHSEIDRRSRAKGARPGALAAWQIALADVGPESAPMRTPIHSDECAPQNHWADCLGPVTRTSDPPVLPDGSY